MGTKRLIAGLSVTAAAVIAACFGDVKESSLSSPLLMAGPMSYDFGTVAQGMSKTSPQIVITSQLVGQDDTINNISENCGDYDLNLPTGFPYRVFCDDMPGGSGSGSAFFGSGVGSGSNCMPNAYAFTASFHPMGAGLSGCTVRVDYSPSTGGSTFFNIALSGTGGAAPNLLTIMPPSGSMVPFGDIPMGQTSASQPITITNSGTNTLTVTGTTLSSAYTVTPAGTATYPTITLGPMTSAVYNVTCHPPSVANADQLMSFTSAAPTVGVQLKCNGIAPTMLQVSPTPVGFASTLVGRVPPDKVVTIQNPGAAPITLDVKLVPATGPISIVGASHDGMSLPTGSTTVTLHYDALAEHANTQIATLNVNGQAIAVSAEALTGVLGVNPGTSIDFGPVCVNGSTQQAVTIYAGGSAKINITSITAPAAPFTAGTANGLLQGNHGNSMMFNAGVMPTAPGDLTGKIMVNTDLVVPSQEITLTAKGLPAGVTPTPDTLHFGPGRVSTPTNVQDVTVSNCGTSPITFSAADVIGASAEEFALVSALPTTALGVKASTKFSVVMTPKTNGQKAAQLVLTYDGGTTAVNLDGNGFAGDDMTGGDKTTYYACNAGGASTFGAVFGLGVLVLRRRRRA